MLIALFNFYTVFILLPVLDPENLRKKGGYIILLMNNASLHIIVSSYLFSNDTTTLNHTHVSSVFSDTGAQGSCLHLCVAPSPL